MNLDVKSKMKNIVPNIILGGSVFLVTILIIFFIKIISGQTSVAVNYYELIFDSNGGTSIKTQKVKKGEFNLPTDVTKEGYEFVGWKVDNEIVESPYIVKKDTTFVAEWKSNKLIVHTVKFDLNGGGSSFTQKVENAEKVSKPNEPTREGYMFNGWYYYGSDYNFETPVLSDIVLTAQWIENKPEVKYYIVTFNLNGGGSNYDKNIASGEKIVKPKNPTRKGYKFNGWYYNNKAYNFNNPVNEDITLVANWVKDNSSSNNDNKKPEENSSPKVYNVVLKNSLGSNVTFNVKAGEKLSRPTNPSLNAFKFVGWYTENGSKYDFNKSVNGNFTLYAKWVPVDGAKVGNIDRVVSVVEPEVISNTDQLGDDKYGKNLFVKAIVNNNGRFYYSHTVSNKFDKKIFYAVRIYNNSDNVITVKINKCAAIMNESSHRLWEKYTDKKCGILGEEYTLNARRSVILLHNGTDLVSRTKNDQSGILPITGSFEGVIDFSVSGQVYVASVAFEVLNNSYNAVYDGEFY